MSKEHRGIEDRPNGGPASAVGREGPVTLTAPAGADLIHEPVHGVRVTDAPSMLFPVSGDFTLGAKVELSEVTGRWSAGVLMVWQDEEHWAKLCLERDHLERPSIITVVTNGWSDDALHQGLPADESYLRVMRSGETFVMHTSSDGRSWHFTRVFRLNGDPRKTRAGFLAQAPHGKGCTATFSEIKWSHSVPADVRDGT